MEVTEEIRILLRTRRKELKYTIEDVVNKTISSNNTKPSLSISTISSIERGDLKNVKQETFDLIVGILGLSITDYELKIKPIKVAFGSCLWSSPIINVVVDEPFDKKRNLELPGLKLTCYNNEQQNQSNAKEQFYLDKFNLNPDENKNSILTANETLSLLENGDVDIAFLPVMTAQKSNDIFRIARCMNTVKGGVYLFIVGKSNDDNLKGWSKEPTKFNYEKLNNIKEVLESSKSADSDKCCFVFPKNSVARIEIEESLYEDTYYEKQAIEITTNEKFKTEILSRIQAFFKNTNATYFVYAGWDYHIHLLQKIFSQEHSSHKELKGLIAEYFDGYRFTKYGHPYPTISYDCIALESRYEYLKNHTGLKTLLKLIGKSVNELNAVKFSKSNSRYRMIAEFLQMEKTFVDSVLKRINWEFLIYPEMYDKELK
jgi:transcriptional regulator with XRE-family HTH domain